jgi:hypothetical protein
VAESAIAKVRSRYAGSAERPLGSFLALMSAYGGLVTTASLLLRSAGRGLPHRIGSRDLVLLAVATFKLSRVMAKDPVTSPLRAPFTKFKSQAGEAELDEEVVGKGPQKAIGELVTCPFCLDQWIATALTLGWLANPRLARLVASTLTVVTAADVLQFGYDALQSSA